MANSLRSLKKGFIWLIIIAMLCTLYVPYLHVRAAGPNVILDVNFTQMDFSAPVLTSGTAGTVGAKYLYDNVIIKDGIKVDATVEITVKSSTSTSLALNPFDAEGTGQTPKRFEPIINSPTAGGYFTFKFSFWDHDNPTNPVYLKGFALTAVDIDGGLEYQIISGYASYQIDATSGLTITNPGGGNTRFAGISGNLTGVQFDNTAAYIAYYTSPITTLNITLGNTGQATGSNRQYSLNFGNVENVFSNPVVVQNPYKPIINVQINDTAGVLDNRTADLTSVPISGTTDAGTGQTVLLTVTDGITTVTGSAIVQLNGSYSTNMNLSALIPGQISATANVVNTGGTPADPAVDTSTIVRYHNVTFVDYDNTVLKASQSVIYGGAAVPPTDPDRYNYIFAGWDVAFNNVTGDLTVKATYTPNTAPDAKNDTASTPANTAKTVTVLSNDTDADGQTLTVTAITQPTHGTAVLNPDGTVTYTPTNGYIGDDTFTYTISDGKGGTDTATVTVTVTNTAPDDNNPNTGDNSNIIYWIFATISCTLLIYLTSRRRVTHNKNL